MESVVVDGLRIAYREAGAGTPVLLLHGGMSDSREWDRQLAGFADRWRVVAWDTPGSGGSDDAPPGWSLDDFARCVVRFAGQLGLEQPHLVGLSFGAGLALAVHRCEPGFARSLALLSGYAGWAGSLPPEQVEARLAACLEAAEHLPEPRLEDGLALTGPDPSQELLEELLAVARDVRPSVYAVAGPALAEADLRDVLPTIAVPTLVVHGAQDQRAPLPIGQALAAAIPGASLVVLPDAGHVLNQEAPTALEAVLRPFLAAAESASRG